MDVYASQGSTLVDVTSAASGFCFCPTPCPALVVGANLNVNRMSGELSAATANTYNAFIKHFAASGGLLSAVINESLGPVSGPGATFFQSGANFTKTVAISFLAHPPELRSGGRYSVAFELVPSGTPGNARIHMGLLYKRIRV